MSEALLAVMVALIVFIIVDFDQPRRGMIRLDPSPHEVLRTRLGRGRR